MSTEVFNHSQVKSVMSDIESDFSTLADLIEKTNSLITTALGSPDKAVYGDAGNKILATWDENCSTLNSFLKIYDNWSLMVVSIAKQYGELDKGTAKVEGADLEAFKTIAAANTTTWLKTPTGSKNYTGSNSSYIDAKTGKVVREKTNLKDKRVVDKGNGTVEYYSLDGKLLGTKKNGQYYDANGKKVSSIETNPETVSEKDLKKAQSTLKKSVATKQEELKKRDKERAELPKYKNPYGLSGYRLEFVESIIKGAVSAYKKYGVLPSLTLAQAILESAWGKSRLASYNNLFGIKEGDWTGKTVTLPTGEQNSDGSYTTIMASFRVYDNVAQSIEDHAKLLANNPKYNEVIAAKNYEQACYAVKAGGYATSINYAINLMNVIRQYGLDQWDPK